MHTVRPGYRSERPLGDRCIEVGSRQRSVLNKGVTHPSRGRTIEGRAGRGATLLSVDESHEDHIGPPVSGGDVKEDRPVAGLKFRAGGAILNLRSDSGCNGAAGRRPDPSRLVGDGEDVKYGSSRQSSPKSAGVESGGIAGRNKHEGCEHSHLHLQAQYRQIRAPEPPRFLFDPAEELLLEREEPVELAIQTSGRGLEHTATVSPVGTNELLDRNEVVVAVVPGKQGSGYNESVRGLH